MFLDFIQITLDGLFTGSSYALIALGFALIFSVHRRVNLAYGSSLLIGAAVAVSLDNAIGITGIGYFLTTVLFSAIACVYVERFCFAPHLGTNSSITPMITSFAIWMQLDEISSKLLPQRTHAFPSPNFGELEIGNILIRPEQLLHFLCVLFLLLLVFQLLKYKNIDLQLKAITENPNLAFSLGLNVHWISIATFIVAGTMGGIGTFLILSADSQVTPLFGLWSTFKGLMAMMIGGMGSLYGALLGGLFLGLFETHAANLFGAEYRDISTFTLIFLFLIFRPGGLVGTNAYRDDHMAKGRL